tara:strand:- start:463 stop:663 length:201 start_codon:yes stop_codon:yes gene_type:complete
MVWKNGGEGSSSSKGNGNLVAPDPSNEGKSGEEEDSKHPTTIVKELLAVSLARIFEGVFNSTGMFR